LLSSPEVTATSSVAGGCKSFGLTLLLLLLTPGFSRGFFERVVDVAELCRFGFGGRSLRIGRVEFGDLSLLFESIDFLLALAREVDIDLSMLGVARNDLGRTDGYHWYYLFLHMMLSCPAIRPAANNQNNFQDSELGSGDSAALVLMKMLSRKSQLPFHFGSRFFEHHFHFDFPLTDHSLLDLPSTSARLQPARQCHISVEQYSGPLRKRSIERYVAKSSIRAG